MRERVSCQSARSVARWLAAVVLLIATSGVAVADVRLPSVFGDHMVVQRGRAVPVWGWADPGEEVTVEFGKQTRSATADKAGKWMVSLEALSAGGPFRMSVKGKNAIAIRDVLVGDVWVCSGQSNMAMTVQRSRDAAKEIAAAKYPKIRMLTVARKTALQPQSDCNARWAVCSSKTVGGFSATAYYFARKLYRELGVPVGLLHTSWGGTPVEAWTSHSAQAAVPAIAPVLGRWKKQIAAFDPAAAEKRYEEQLARWKKAKAAGKKRRRPRKPVHPRLHQHRPANLYNGMIAPLIPYAVRGAIWYQGEHNAGREFPHLYQTQLPTMIEDWRKRWKQGDFPFLFVQLPNFRTRQTQPVEPSGWVTVREGMLKTLAVPNTGMAITVDVGEARDIHPKNKQDVGKRLALWALGTTYKKDIVYSGPLPKANRFDGARARVTFSHFGKGLKTPNSEDVRGFAVAGPDRKWVAAKAKIDRDSVVVWAPGLKKIVAVRYGWAANPVCNLFNSAGLPASPFRTDDWKQ